VAGQSVYSLRIRVDADCGEQKTALMPLGIMTAMDDASERNGTTTPRPARPDHA
jgi:hypothetical protein